MCAQIHKLVKYNDPNWESELKTPQSLASPIKSCRFWITSSLIMLGLPQVLVLAVHLG